MQVDQFVGIASHGARLVAITKFGKLYEYVMKDGKVVAIKLLHEIDWAKFPDYRDV